MTKLIPILSGRCLVVELPEGAPTPDVINTGQPHLSWLDIDINLPDINLPPGTWQIVGMLPEVTEEQAADIADVHMLDGIRSYTIYTLHTSKSGSWTDSAIKSLESSILAEGYYLDDNPMGGKPEMVAATDDDFDDFDFPNERGQRKWEEWEDDYNKWNESQSRVLDRERCLLLRRME